MGNPGDVIYYYLKILGAIGIVVFIAILLVYIFKTKLPSLISQRKRILYQVIGTALLLTAGVGKLGWVIQTWNGNTSVEEWNEVLFKFFLIIGTFLIFIDPIYRFLSPIKPPTIKNKSKPPN